MNLKSKIENPKWLGLLVIAFVLAVAVVVAEAQQPAKIPRVGLVSSTGDPRTPGPLVDAFRHKLSELGYVEGKNIQIEYRYAEGKLERVPRMVEELIRLRVDALVVSSVPAIRAAKRAAAAVPVVMITTIDPVTADIVQSLKRPGGNITGITSLGKDLRRGALELLKETVPGITRAGILWNTEGRASATAYKDYEASARARNIQAQSLEVRGATPDLAGAFQAAVKAHANALIAVSNTVLARYQKQMAELAIKHRLPSLSERTGYAQAGGFMDYSADYEDNFRRVAVYVDKILKGAKPADLPLEQTKFILDINLTTAKQLGLTVPAAVVARANRVIK
jgi:putative ABC transport system substrate-binding protein